MLRYPILLLDNDGTLMDFSKAQAAAFERAYRLCSLPQKPPFSPEILELYDRCNKSWWAKLEQGLCTKEQLQWGRFADLFQALGLPEDPKAFNEIYMQGLGEGRFLLPGALELVKEASRTREIYIITNGVTETQHSRIEKSPLFPWVKGIFVSEEIGFVKPRREYFEAVLRKIGCEDRKKCLVIGDSLSSDIQGAANSGIDALWYNPGHLPNPKGLPMIAQVSSLSEISDFFACRHGSQRAEF